jgi:hypothetical protein
MRTQVLDYIRDVNPGGFFVTEELPWSESGLELYLKNLKRVYVDVEQTETEDLLLALNGLNIQNRIHIIRVFFATDAKTLPPNYEDFVAALRRVNDIPAEGFQRRQISIETELENDVLVTELEYRFTKLLT